MFRVACKRVRSLIAFGCVCEMRLDAFLSSIALGRVYPAFQSYMGNILILSQKNHKVFQKKK